MCSPQHIFAFNTIYLDGATAGISTAIFYMIQYFVIQVEHHSAAIPA